jgi:hypothetical protein
MMMTRMGGANQMMISLYVVCSVCAVVHPLCVIPDFGGDKNAYIVVLPKHNWSRYFGDQIQSRKRKASGGNRK